MTAIQQAQQVAGLIPAKIRGVIYTLIGVAVALEAIWDVVPGPHETKVLASLTVLGFGLAVGNTGTSDTGNDDGIGESGVLMTIVLIMLIVALGIWIAQRI